MKTLLNGLLHRVAVEGAVFDGPVRLRLRFAENLQGFVLGRCREGKVARVGQQPAGLHQPVDLVLVGLVLLHPSRFRERTGNRCAGAAALAGVGLVDDDGKPAPALLVADLVEDEREFLHRRDDDLLAVLDEPPQVAGALGVPDRRTHHGVLLDRVADLLVQDAAVGDDDNRVERNRPVMFQPDQLMGQPGDRIALAAPRGVLDEIALSGAVLCHVGQQAANNVELLVARPDLSLLRARGLVVLGLDHLSVVFQDVGQALAGKHLSPEIVALDAVWVGRVAGAVVPAAVEGQEPGCLAFEVGAEADVVVVDREMGHAPAELEQLLARIAIALVLFDGVVDGLLRQAVLEFECQNWQAVDEQHDIERPLGLVPAVAQLPGDGEPVLIESLFCFLIAGGRGAVEEI